MTTRKVLLAAFMLVLFSVSVGAQITMTPPVFQGIDNSGNPCSACKLYIYQTGTATPVTAYMNVGLTTAHPFPRRARQQRSRIGVRRFGGYL